jgi:hypothetical protein
MACKVLFGSGDSHKIIDRIVLDLAYFQYVKSVKNDVGICENIKDSTIKEACKSPKIKEFGSFFTSRP